MSTASAPSDIHQAVVWLIARISEREHEITHVKQHLDELEQRYTRLEREHRLLRENVKQRNVAPNAESVPQLASNTQEPPMPQASPAPNPTHRGPALPEFPLSAPQDTPPERPRQLTSDNQDILHSPTPVSTILPDSTLSAFRGEQSGSGPWAKYGLDKSAYLLIRVGVRQYRAMIASD